ARIVNSESRASTSVFATLTREQSIVLLVQIPKDVAPLMSSTIPGATNSMWPALSTLLAPAVQQRPLHPHLLQRPSHHRRLRPVLQAPLIPTKTVIALLTPIRS